MDADSLIDVYWPIDFLEADAIRQALNSQGIFVHLDGENQSGQAGGGICGNAGRGRMRLLVKACDADRVMEIINHGSWPNYTPG
jgi:hypothetical protein